jgi:hypothetical protein
MQKVPFGWRYISPDELVAMSDKDIFDAALDASHNHVSYRIWRDRLLAARHSARLEKQVTEATGAA